MNYFKNETSRTEVRGFLLLGKNTVLITVIVLFFTALTILSLNSGKPFYGEHDWNGVRYGNIARNYLKYSFFETKLGQIENSGNLKKDEFEFFTHYPPLFPLVISLSYKIFGISEWSTRLVPILFSSGIIVLIFLIGEKLKDFRLGIISSLLALLTPLFLYFGKNPVHESMVVFFVLLSFLFYLKWNFTNKKNLFWFILSLTLAHFSTWSGFFLLPAIFIITLLKKDFYKLLKILPLFIIPILVFLIHLIHSFVLTGSFLGGGLDSVFLQRAGISDGGKVEDLNLINYILRLKLWFFTLLTATLTVFSALFIVTRNYNKLEEMDWNILILGVFGITYFVLFPNAGYIHNYLIFYLLPFLAISSAAIVLKFLQKEFLKKYSMLVILLFLLAVLLERKDFLIALNISSGDKLAVTIGKEINRKTKTDDLIVISPANFKYSADNFLKFYSDRKLIYSDGLVEGIDYKVLVDQMSNKFEIIKQ